MKKISADAMNRIENFKGHQLTIGLDLGDRWSSYCVLDEEGKIILEDKLPTTPAARKQVLGRMTRREQKPLTRIGLLMEGVRFAKRT
jgi:predicted NBD/HSP70 family sugar kinase